MSDAFALWVYESLQAGVWATIAITGSSVLVVVLIAIFRHSGGESDA